MDDWFRDPRAYRSHPDLGELMHDLAADIRALRQDITALRARAREFGTCDIVVPHKPKYYRPRPASALSGRVGH